MKTILIVCFLYAVSSTNVAFGLSCEEDNSVELPIGSHCCCTTVTNTTNDKSYKCTVKKDACTSSTTEIGMKNSSDQKICPCDLKQSKKAQP